MKLSRLFSVSCAVLAFAVSAKANIVVNGDFSPTNYTYPGYSAPASSTSVGGWTLSSPNVGGTPYFNGYGFYNYDPQAAHPTAGFIQGIGSLSQLLNLTVGHTYSYSFLYDARLYYAPTLFTATVGSTNLLSSALIPGLGFLTGSGTFLATGNENLVFSGNAGGADGTALVTGVNVEDLTPTPEPSSLALLGTGVLSLAGFARRKFAKA